MKRPTGPRVRLGRRELIAGAAFLAVAAGVAGWVSVSTLVVRAHLESARVAISSLQKDLADGERPDAATTLRLAQQQAAAAAQDTADPAWTITANLPLAGRPIRVIRQLARSADELAHFILPDLMAAAPADKPTGLRAAADQNVVDLAAIVRARQPLADAQRRLAAVIAQLDALPADSGLSEIDSVRADLADRLARLENTVDAASSAARLLPPMLGDDGARRYFLAFQTGAEARGTGGLVGAYGVVVADHGHVSFAQLAPDDAIQPAAQPVADFGPAFTALYGPDESAQLLANSNLSPNFPYAARIWTGLWRRQTGQRLDGAIATDPNGLADLLSVIGPVEIPDGESVTAQNVVPLTEQTAYGRYPDPVARKRFLIQIATSVVGALSNRPHDLPGLLRALSAAVGGGHLKMWSADPAEEAGLSTTAVGGALPQRPGPFSELVVNNASGTKLDYYLKRSLTYSLGTCRQGSRTSTVRVRLTNGAPATGLPDYGVDRLDDPRHSHVRGSNRLWVSVFAADGAQLTGASLDGARQLMSVNTELGHPVFSAGIDLNPGQTRTLLLSLTEPASSAPPLVPQQPLTFPQTTRIEVAPC